MAWICGSIHYCLAELSTKDFDGEKCQAGGFVLPLYRQEIQAQDQQLSAAQAALAAKEAEGRTATAAAGAAASQALKELAAEKGQLEAKVTALSQQLQQLREQHEAEMVHVEYRVKGVIAKKDDAIVRLQQQLSSALEQMRGTEAVLAAQQAELYE